MKKQRQRSRQRSQEPGHVEESAIVREQSTDSGTSTNDSLSGSSQANVYAEIISIDSDDSVTVEESVTAPPINTPRIPTASHRTTQDIVIDPDNIVIAPDRAIAVPDSAEASAPAIAYEPAAVPAILSHVPARIIVIDPDNIEIVLHPEEVTFAEPAAPPEPIAAPTTVIASHPSGAIRRTNATKPKKVANGCHPNFATHESPTASIRTVASESVAELTPAVTSSPSKNFVSIKKRPLSPTIVSVVPSPEIVPHPDNDAEDEQLEDSPDVAPYDGFWGCLYEASRCVFSRDFDRRGRTSKPYMRNPPQEIIEKVKIRAEMEQLFVAPNGKETSFASLACAGLLPLVSLMNIELDMGNQPSQEALSRNSKVSVFKGPKYACGVCHDYIKRGAKIRRLRCSHFFHYNCIDLWLQFNCTCPLCRYNINRRSPSN